MTDANGTGMVLRHTATREGKLAGFLRGEMGLSHGLMKRLKYQGAYHVNGAPARTNHPVRAGDLITVRICEDQPAVPAEDGALCILYEDEAVIALDKPPGLLMHPTHYRPDGTLVNRLLGYYRSSGQACAAHLVTRLDRDTFGVVLAAKNAHMHAALCAQMQAGGIEKNYHAAVWGRPPREAGEILHPIARVPGESLLRCVRADGKPARTAYRVLAEGESASLLWLRPHTGRTHQLRVHCAHEGFPILGDAQYGTAASQAYAQGCGYGHQQLCAQTIGFDHPLTGRRMTVWSGQTVGLPSP